MPAAPSDSIIISTPGAFLAQARTHAVLLLLTACTFLVHGYHPFAEDGGLYVAGILFRLNPSLFPHDRPFVAAHLVYSLFSPTLAALTRDLGLPIAWVLLPVYLLSIWLTLYAAHRLCRKLFAEERASLYAVVLLASAFTLPIAGTSLLLMDPYVTARTLSTPLCILALSCIFSHSLATDLQAMAKAAVCLLAAAAFHPLMAFYAAVFAALIWLEHVPESRARWSGRIVFLAAAMGLAMTVQCLSPPEPGASRLADISRYYWFLSQWRWFEWLGLAGPLCVLGLSLRGKTLPANARILSRASIVLGLTTALIATLSAREDLASHALARLQPLRSFLLIYVAMVLILSAQTARLLKSGRGLWRLAAALSIPIAVCGAMFSTQRFTFPASQHFELPWQAPRNPWSQAFVWARDHTPADALFAADAEYITLPREDAQTFRATAQRSILADFSKDGGEAAITPALAPLWLAQSVAQRNLSLLSDEDRDARLAPFHVGWLVLRSDASTGHVCPYDNGLVKVCSAKLFLRRP